MLNLPIKRFSVWLMGDQPKFSHSIARPARGFALAVTLQEEAQGLLLLTVGRGRLSRHHHDLPRQVTDVTRWGKHGILKVSEVMNCEAKGRLGTRFVVFHFGVKTGKLWEKMLKLN